MNIYSMLITFFHLRCASSNTISICFLKSQFIWRVSRSRIGTKGRDAFLPQSVCESVGGHGKWEKERYEGVDILLQTQLRMDLHFAQEKKEFFFFLCCSSDIQLNFHP